MSENGTVKMAIYQKVSSIDASTKKDTNGPTTNKRSIESNVLVDDGSIVVLGGLMQDEYSGSADKVPLMGFLRPVVVRDAADADAITAGRYDSLRGVQQTVQPTPNAMLPSVTGAPVLPALSGKETAKDTAKDTAKEKAKEGAQAPTSTPTTDTQPVTDKKP